MTRSTPLYLFVMAALFAAMYGSLVAWRHSSLPHPAAVHANSAPVGFTDQNGQSFDWDSLAGHVWIGSFFYTSCPTICWRQNLALAAVQRETAGSDIRLVSITCDPAQDTPAVLKTYAERLEADPARWTFLTGKLADIIRLGTDRFGVSVEQGTHSDRAVVFDADGKNRGSFRTTVPEDVARMQKLLSNLTSPAPVGQPDATPSPR